MTTTCFITHHQRANRGTESGIEDLSEGGTICIKTQITDFWSFQFCRILTEAGGMYKRKQLRVPCTQPSRSFMKCTLIVVYYDDDMTECTDDLHYPNSVDGFFKLLLGSSIRKLKSLLLSLLFSLWLLKLSSSLHSADATFVLLTCTWA